MAALNCALGTYEIPGGGLINLNNQNQTEPMNQVLPGNQGGIPFFSLMNGGITFLPGCHDRCDAIHHPSGSTWFQAKDEKNPL